MFRQVVRATIVFVALAAAYIALRLWNSPVTPPNEPPMASAGLSELKAPERQGPVEDDIPKRVRTTDVDQVDHPPMTRRAQVVADSMAASGSDSESSPDSGRSGGTNRESSSDDHEAISDAEISKLTVLLAGTVLKVRLVTEQGDALRPGAEAIFEIVDPLYVQGNKLRLKHWRVRGEVITLKKPERGREGFLSVKLSRLRNPNAARGVFVELDGTADTRLAPLSRRREDYRDRTLELLLRVEQKIPSDLL